MNAPIDWVSASAVLAAGLVLGVLLVYFSKRKQVQKLGGDSDLERKDLEAKRDALVQQLRDPSIGRSSRRDEPRQRRDECRPAHGLRAFYFHDQVS